MTSLLLVSVAGTIGLVRLWSIRRSRGALLALAVPAGLLPLAAAAVVGAWEFKAAWEQMGETGTGGLATYIGHSRDWIQTLLFGCAVGVGVIATAMLMAGRRRDQQMPATATGSLRSAGVVAAAAVTAAIVTMPVVLARSERAAIGPMVKLVPLVKLDAAPDFGYPEIRAMRNQDIFAQQLHDFRLATFGGLAIVVVMAGCLLLGRWLRPPNATGAGLTVATTAVALAVLGAGIWYGAHALSVSRMLDATAKL